MRRLPLPEASTAMPSCTAAATRSAFDMNAVSDILLSWSGRTSEVTERLALTRLLPSPSSFSAFLMALYLLKS